MKSDLSYKCLLKMMGVFISVIIIAKIFEIPIKHGVFIPYILLIIVALNLIFHIIKRKYYEK